MKYKTKPIVVEAIQWNEDNLEEVMKFLDSEFKYEKNTSYCTKKFQYITINKSLNIKVNNAMTAVSKGDYIIKSSKDNYYVLMPEIFKKICEKENENDNNK